METHLLDDCLEILKTRITNLETARDDVYQLPAGVFHELHTSLALIADELHSLEEKINRADERDQEIEDESDS